MLREVPGAGADAGGCRESKDRKLPSIDSWIARTRTYYMALLASSGAHLRCAMLYTIIECSYRPSQAATVTHTREMYSPNLVLIPRPFFPFTAYAFFKGVIGI